MIRHAFSGDPEILNCSFAILPQLFVAWPFSRMISDIYDIGEEGQQARNSCLRLHSSFERCQVWPTVVPFQKECLFTGLYIVWSVQYWSNVTQYIVHGICSFVDLFILQNIAANKRVLLSFTYFTFLMRFADSPGCLYDKGSAVHSIMHIFMRRRTCKHLWSIMETKMSFWYLWKKKYKR